NPPRGRCSPHRQRRPPSPPALPARHAHRIEFRCHRFARRLTFPSSRPAPVRRRYGRVTEKGGPCDPSSKNDAGGTPASELLPDYRKVVHPIGEGLCRVLPPAA